MKRKEIKLWKGNSGIGGGGGSGRKTPQQIADSYRIDVEKTIGDFPKLQGSEKQISWAENLRENAYRSLNSIIEAETIVGRSADGKTVFYNTGNSSWKNSDGELRVQAALKAKNTLNSFFKTTTSSSKIIDMRTRFSRESLSSLVNRAVAYKKKTGSFPD